MERGADAPIGLPAFSLGQNEFLYSLCLRLTNELLAQLAGILERLEELGRMGNAGFASKWSQ